MNNNLEQIWKSLAPLGKLFKELLGEANFLTLVCGFLVVMMILNFYRFLRGINPALVGLLLLLILGILILNWTYTRTEPAFMRPFIQWLAPFFPAAP